MKKTLTTYQIAEYCQVTPRTAVQWINEGKLKAYRTPGNHSRVSVTDFMDFLKQYNMPVPKELACAVLPAAPPGKKRILIVDDDEGVVDALRRFLTREEVYELDTAYDGFEAGRKFSLFRPDLVILDIKMPGLNGYKVCANIRSNPSNKEVKIILISGLPGENQEGMLEEWGADAYLEKPFNGLALREKLEALLEGGGHGQKT